ncbi:DUF805 domain-containing protein [Palleronia sp. KMU-117]|uniref:DUF805 domain-containing protein n=1 Tax=Palleronia sp. KMU-117 TaxID=3434108 RepID=UPI003D745EBD
MGFQDAIRSVFSKYVTISGRASRSEYWWWFLFVVIGQVILGGIDSALFGAGPDSPGLLAGLFSLAILLPSICVAGRRLHDRDMSAWWLLLGLIPVIGFLVLLYFYVTKGTDGPNRFGPDPLRPGSGDFGGDAFARSSIPPSGR